MKRVFCILFMISLLFPHALFAQEGEAGEAGEYIFDDPSAAIEPNPIMDLSVISETGFASYRADEAKSLDTYTNQNIEFDILVDADIEEMSNAFLILSVYDVDVDSIVPEVDKVYLNDHYIGNLTGDNNAWSFTTFPLKTEWINGYKKGASGVNRIRIEIDSLKSSTFWVLCDWGAIKANIGFQVVSIIPSGISIGSNKYEVYVKFNEEIDEESLKGNIKLTYIDFNEIKDLYGEITYDPDNYIATFSAVSSLVYGVEYTVRVKPAIRNIRGQNLKSERITTFVTLPALKVDSK